MSELVVAIDQGSSSTKVRVLDAAGTVVGRSEVKVSEAHPRPGWVEQDADELWDSAVSACAAALAGLDAARVVAVGLSNQRESLVLWDRATGRALGPVVSWQDQRTVDLCAALVEAGAAATVREISGLPLDPMFSALKARWLLDHHDPDRSRSARGEICLGTVDSWLLSRAAPGREHVVEAGNASRSQLLDIAKVDWSAELTELFGVPASTLPRIVPSDGTGVRARGLGPVPDGTPVAAVLGDSHAALFGHGVRAPGAIKATYGTGSSVMALIDAERVRGSDLHGMGLTVAWQRAGGEAKLALEGNIRASGATLMWLARLLGSTPGQLAELAADADSEGVHLVPAFTGLGAPWWDPAATGLVDGLGLGTGPAQLARAALESVALQVQDVVAAARAAGAPVDVLLADGGAANNDLLMQLQADIGGTVVERATVADASAVGAAHLAGLAVGLWDDAELAARHERQEERRTFSPATTPEQQAARIGAWHSAVARSRLQQ